MRRRWIKDALAPSWALTDEAGAVVAQVSLLIGRYYYEVPGETLLRTGWKDTRHAAQLAVWAELRRRRVSTAAPAPIVALKPAQTATEDATR